MLCSNRGMAFEEMEAIRLGAVKYDLKTKQISYFDAFIRPQNKQPLSNFCKQLTGITDEDLKEAKNFKQVFSDFLTWIGGVKKSRFFSWSKSDMTRLIHDAKINQVAPATITKIQSRYVDFQHVFSTRVSKQNMSVENALKLYDLEFAGEPHNPMYDAFNTLRIYFYFLNKPVHSDIIMLNQFIFHGTLISHEHINAKLKQALKQDIVNFLQELDEIYKIRQAQKVIKKAKQLVKKYENILYNRSGIFSQEMIDYVNLLKGFYHDLVTTYREHFRHASKIMILDAHLVEPMKQIAS